MSDKTEATEMVLNKIDEYMNAAKTVIEQYGGDVADLGLLALRVEAGSELLVPLISLIAIFFVSRAALVWRKNEFGDDFELVKKEHIKKILMMGYSKSGYAAHSKAEKILGSIDVSAYNEAQAESLCETIDWPVKRIASNHSEGRVVSLVIISAVTAAIAIPAFINTLNIWAWVGLFYPEAYAVHLFLLK